MCQKDCCERLKICETCKIKKKTLENLVLYGSTHVHIPYLEGSTTIKLEVKPCYFLPLHYFSLFFAGLLKSTTQQKKKHPTLKYWVCFGPLVPSLVSSLAPFSLDVPWHYSLLLYPLVAKISPSPSEGMIIRTMQFHPHQVAVTITSMLLIELGLESHMLLEAILQHLQHTHTHYTFSYLLRLSSAYESFLCPT